MNFREMTLQDMREFLGVVKMTSIAAATLSQVKENEELRKQNKGQIICGGWLPHSELYKRIECSLIYRAMTEYLCAMKAGNSAPSMDSTTAED